MTEPLSRAARAVLDAATSVCHPETEIVAFQCTRLEVAAALRSAADQVAPDDYASFTGHIEWDQGMEARSDSIREALLAIAAELDGSVTPD